MVDAREQLRRYLEQRRDMGESELMLDSLTVDEALRLLGAKNAPASSSAPAAPTRSADGVAPAARPVDHTRVSDTTSSAHNEQGSGDWRGALRAAGASPADTTKPKIGRFEFPADRPRASGDTPAAGITERNATLGRGASPSAPILSSPLSDVPSGLSVGPESGATVGGSISELSSLDAVARHVAGCTRCPLYSSATNPVPGEGNPNADLMCVGEAPGAMEDQTGRPFIGAAGQLLTKILEAIQQPREQVYICNVLKHRPPGNRNPLAEEVTACSPYLIRQIELVRPRVIIALGTFAAQTLLNSQLSLGKLRGQIHRFYGVPLIVTYHPAALLRNPSWKRPTWEDVQLARRILDSPVSGA